MSYLVAHDWDKYGDPPPPGEPYHFSSTIDWTKIVARIDKLVKDANGRDEEAEEKRQEAQEDDDAAEELRNEAADIITEEVDPVDREYAEMLRKRFDLS